MPRYMTIRRNGFPPALLRPLFTEAVIVFIGIILAEADRGVKPRRAGKPY